MPSLQNDKHYDRLLVVWFNVCSGALPKNVLEVITELINAASARLLAQNSGLSSGKLYDVLT